MARPLYVVPGILGSEMREVPSVHGPTLWLNVVRLALGQFRLLALADDGVSPLPGVGGDCFPGFPIDFAYGQLISRLSAELPDRSVVPFGYDWRKRIELVGDQLAQTIRDRATVADPAEIVAHSQGGLVARCAWRSLVLSGHSSLVRRIVSLGTPWHDGSYAACLLWHFNDEQFVQLYAVGAATRIATGGLVPGQMGYASLNDLVKVTATWPSLYELLPPLRESALVADPNRSAIYDVDTWPEERGISAAHLAHAAGPWLELLDSAESTPPPHVLTCVAGRGFGTPEVLRDPSILGRYEAFKGTFEGDGRVTVQSALGPGGRTFVGNSGHGDLLIQPWVLDQVAEWVQEERSQPAPPAPVVVDQSRTVATLPPPVGMRAGILLVGHDC